MGPLTSRRQTRSSRRRLVRAAGAVCWRESTAHDGLEVLLVHRPQYDDWSWPKGKLDEEELLPVAAVREVTEETGLDVSLGVPLPAARYQLGQDVDKHVTYWAAHVTADPPAPPHPDEVDESRWFTADEARRRLTRRGDRQQLQALLEAHAEGVLDTFPVVVLRHGKAMRRKEWARDDGDRPLNGAGTLQAQRLVPVLRAWRPEQVLSSPAERCVSTVQPLVEASSTPADTVTCLSEDGHRVDPAAVRTLVGSLLSGRRATVVCTHRPVLPTLLGALAGNATAGVAETVPRRDPFLSPGEVLVAHVSRRTGRVVAVERHTDG